MDIHEARRILGVTDNATLKEVKLAYRRGAAKTHPDKGGDDKNFQAVNVAYLMLIADVYGVDTVDEAPLEFAEAIDIRHAIDAQLDEIIIEFKEIKYLVQSESIERICDLIEGAKNKSDLKNVLQNQVSKELSEINGAISGFIKNKYDGISDDRGGIIFGMFSELYESRRKMWVTNLWRNPIVIFEGLGLLIIILNLFINVFEIERDINLFFGLVLIGGIALFYDYNRLNPKKQFIPPRMSIDSLQSFLSNQKSNIGLTQTETIVGGSLAGTTIGTILLPGIGTILGGITGYFLGSLFGKPLGDIKIDIKYELKKEINIALDQIDKRLNHWIDCSKEDIYKAYVSCFYKNSLNLLKLEKQGKLALLEKLKV